MSKLNIDIDDSLSFQEDFNKKVLSEVHKYLDAHPDMRFENVEFDYAKDIVENKFQIRLIFKHKKIK